MNDIKPHPKDVVDSLKDKKKKDFSITKTPKYDPLPNHATTSQIEEYRMKNEILKMEYLQAKTDEHRRLENMESNLCITYSIIFSSFCDRELQN